MAGRKRKSDMPGGHIKRPLSGYMHFTQALRQEYRAKGKDMKPTEFAKAASEKWKVMNVKDKAPYESMYAKDKKRYDKEMAPFKKAKKTGPKKPPTAYILYTQDFRATLTTEQRKKVTEVIKNASVKWKALTPSEKKKYDDRAAKLKAEWVATNEDNAKNGAAAASNDTEEDEEEDEDEESDEEEEEEE